MTKSISNVSRCWQYLICMSATIWGQMRKEMHYFYFYVSFGYSVELIARIHLLKNIFRIRWLRIFLLSRNIRTFISTSEYGYPLYVGRWKNTASGGIRKSEEVYYWRALVLLISGGSINASDVMVPSAESVIRNFLYGQSYYKKNSGVKRRTDIMLPDCFGFPYSHHFRKSIVE